MVQYAARSLQLAASTCILIVTQPGLQHISMQPLASVTVIIEKIANRMGHDRAIPLPVHCCEDLTLFIGIW